MLVSPIIYRDSPNMTDPLSEVLALLDAQSVVSTSMKAGGDWSVRVGHHHGLKFNGVVKGSAWLVIEGHDDPIPVSAGDCFLLARGLPFVLASDLDKTPIDAEIVFNAAQGDIAIIGEGDDFHVAGGKMTLDPMTAGILTRALPDHILLPASSDQAVAMQWMLDRFATEVDGNRPGHRASAEKLMHLMFIELIRAHLKSKLHARHGWLNALADPRIGKALCHMHDQPLKPWTLLELADVTGMSRSNFARQFKASVGTPPLEYLTRWRMHMARRDLMSLQQPIAQTARRYGYNSESAFGNAYKRIFGEAPRRSIAGYASRNG